MSYKYMRRCSSVVIREMQFKTTEDTISYPAGWYIIFKMENNKCWHRCRETKYTACGTIKSWNLCEGQFAGSSKVVLPYDPTILVPGIYPKELKTGTQTYMCTPTFITALFAIAQRKQPKCLSAGE